MNKRKIYLDYAATTSVDPLVFKAMLPYFREKYGNPGSLHKFGQEAIAALDKAREIIAKSIGANFNEIIFTGSATEASNLALRGIIKTLRIFDAGKIGKNQKYLIQNPRIIISAIEHESILETAKDLEQDGIEVIFIPVNKEGVVDLREIKKSLNDQTVLISVMYANNEIGVIEPISEIAKIISEFKKNKKQIYPLFHTDAVQAFQFLDCNVNNLGVDLMTLSAHKIYGPKGVGLLYAKGLKPLSNELARKGILFNNSFLKPIITGGGQEFGFRSGTENIPLIVGFARAIQLVGQKKLKELKRMRKIKDFFYKELRKAFSDVQIFNCYNTLPNIISVYFPGFSAQDVLIKLDQEGIEVSSGSACLMRAATKSHVLGALGFKNERILGNVRFSFGRYTKKDDIKELIKRLKKVLFN
ncbi:MAG: cysteine desulfurase family protein [Patescibacteria group bacterium]|nr:cysteine desulfurase family protein [Patescibacteria group bacterium]